MVFTLSLSGVRGEIPAGEYFIDWRRTANDGRTERGRAPASLTEPLVIRTSLDRPGFVKIEANLIDKTGKFVPKKHLWEKRVFFQGGAGVEVDKLQAWPEPKDFDAHWTKEKALVDGLPLKVTERKPLPCANPAVNLWQVKIPIVEGYLPMTGYLVIPKNASVTNRMKATGHLSGYYMWKEACPSFLTNCVDGIQMYINRHGCEGDREEAYYKSFLKNPPYGADHFRGMALRGLMMFRYLKSLPEWDGKTLESKGSSGGAMQSLWMAALVPELTRIDIGAPALGDVFGFKYGRETGNLGVREEAINYYDICNFAKRITIPVSISAGLGDYTCPPFGIAIVYNNLRGPKRIEWKQGTTHGWWPGGMAVVKFSDAGGAQLKAQVGEEHLVAGSGNGGDVLRVKDEVGRTRELAAEQGRLYDAVAAQKPLACRIELRRVKGSVDIGKYVSAALTTWTRPPRKGVMSPARPMTDDDFATLKKWNVSLLRYQMTEDFFRHGEMKGGYPAYRKWLDGKLDHLLDFVLPMARKNGIKVVVDLHVPPGGRATSSQDWSVYSDALNLERFFDTWRHIAERLRGNADVIYGYDLLNEPVQEHPATAMDYLEVYERAAQIVRSVDKLTPVIVQSLDWDAPETFERLRPISDPNTIYEVHMYRPQEFTHQGTGAGKTALAVWPDKAKGWNRDFIREKLKAVRAFEQKHKARIYVGEFSATAFSRGADAYLADCLSVFGEYGWDWTYHAFREWEAWSVEHEPSAGVGTVSNRFVPSSDNARKRVLLRGMSAAGEDPARYVDPFIGTSATGHTFPGACVPFGMVQASPDTGTGSWDYVSGYRFEDKTLRGFSNTHLNGTGGCDLGDVLLLPFVGERCEQGVSIDKTTEKAEAGWYSVCLDGGRIRAEASATEHVAIYRFTSLGEGPMNLLVDGQWGLVNGGRMSEFVQDCRMKVEESRRISGWRKTHDWCTREIWFDVQFDRPYKSCRELPSRNSREKGRRYVCGFDLKRGDRLIVKVALSRKSAEGAKRNLAQEIPGWDFDDVRSSARQAWNAILSRCVAEGSEAQMTNWYTSAYHLFLQPNILSDANERPFYSTFSCWDTFRAAGPLYTVLAPELAANFADSMLEQGRITGFLPIWTLWGEDNQCMIGTHSIPMIVDAWLKGVWPASACRGDRDGTVENAYQQIKDTLTKRHEGRYKENWDLYDQYGYYPCDKIRGESVSRTMECAYDDWCAAQMAKKLGKMEDYAFFMKRSAHWKNVFDPSLGLVRGKDSNGKWREPFDPFALGHGANRDNDFTEGNAFQYSWHVMQDPQGLIEAMGGRMEFIRKLDSLFVQPSKTAGMGDLVDVTGLIGQYVHGNEPSHHVIYFYPQVGCPDKAAERVREVFDRFYSPKPDGLCGNDDCGQMSAWYLFSAMGFYPFNPCGGEYVIGAPQLPKVELKVGKRTPVRFVMIAKDLSKENKYVKSVTLNGKKITDRKIRHADILAGGELVFEMTAK